MTTSRRPTLPPPPMQPPPPPPPPPRGTASCRPRRPEAPNADDHAQHGGKRAPKEPRLESAQGRLRGHAAARCLLLSSVARYYAHKLRAVMFAPHLARRRRAGPWQRGGGGGGAASLGDASPLSLAEAAVASARQSGRGGESGGGGGGYGPRAHRCHRGRFGRDLSRVYLVPFAYGRSARTPGARRRRGRRLN